MIDTKELRRENLVKLGEEVVAVREISYMRDADSGREGYLINENLADEFSPIPLSEEWLLRLGFERKNGTLSNWYVSNGFVLGYIDSDEVIQTEWCLCQPLGKWAVLDIKHVHQLQNLFFALTGEELTIKEGVWA